jgi:hypothetical protein
MAPWLSAVAPASIAGHRRARHTHRAEETVAFRLGCTLTWPLNRWPRTTRLRLGEQASIVLTALRCSETRNC